MNNFDYANFAWEQAAALLAIDSPSGCAAKAADWVKDAFETLGFDTKITTKGGVLVDLGGADANDGLLLAAHADTLGGMVCQIKGSGRLKLTNIGGMRAENSEAENVKVYTRDGKIIEGTLQLCNASVHVNDNYKTTARDFDTTEVLLDEDVTSAEDVCKLGIEVGDYVCFDPRTRRTQSGYLKSRFLDDKLSVGILLGLAKYLSDNKIVPKRRTWALRGSGARRRGIGSRRSYRSHVRGYGLCGRGLKLHRAAGFHLRQGFRRPLQLRSGRQAH